MYPTNKPRRISPSTRLLSMSEPSGPSTRRLASTGRRKNIPMANTNENVRVAAIWLFPISWPSASAPTLAEYIRARIPRLRVSASTRTPRSTGTLRSLPVYSWPSGSHFMASVPSGLRTAMLAWRCPRIMTPSITACPPYVGVLEAIVFVVAKRGEMSSPLRLDRHRLAGLLQVEAAPQPFYPTLPCRRFSARQCRTGGTGCISRPGALPS